MEIKVLREQELVEVLPTIARLRLTYFKDFPYLYEGTQSYEERYLKEFSLHPQSVVVVAYENQKIVAISTGMPLNCEADILSSIPKSLVDAEHNYYLAETIIEASHRKKGLTRSLVAVAEKEAKSMGFRTTSLLTVVRSKVDSRKPVDYYDTDNVWSGLGYRKSSIVIDFEWPAKNEDNEVVKMLHPMVFWLKDIV